MTKKLPCDINIGSVIGQFTQFFKIVDGDKVRLKIAYRSKSGSTWKTFEEEDVWLLDIESRSINDLIRPRPNVPNVDVKMTISINNTNRGTITLSTALN